MLNLLYLLYQYILLLHHLNIANLIVLMIYLNIKNNFLKKPIVVQIGVCNSTP